MTHGAKLGIQTEINRLLLYYRIVLFKIQSSQTTYTYPGSFQNLIFIPNPDIVLYLTLGQHHKEERASERVVDV